MEGHEVATSTFKLGKSSGMSKYCPQATTMLAQVMSEAESGSTKAKKAIADLIAKAKRMRSNGRHKRCVKMS